VNRRRLIRKIIQRGLRAERAALMTSTSNTRPTGSQKKETTVKNLKTAKTTKKTSTKKTTKKAAAKKTKRGTGTSVETLRARNKKAGVKEPKGSYHCATCSKRKKRDIIHEPGCKRFVKHARHASSTATVKTKAAKASSNKKGAAKAAPKKTVKVAVKKAA
jgi:hypothetical protein